MQDFRFHFRRKEIDQITGGQFKYMIFQITGIRKQCNKYCEINYYIWVRLTDIWHNKKGGGVLTWGAMGLSYWSSYI